MAMLHKSAADEQAEIWQIDVEIEDAMRLLRIWETHAQIHSGTAFGELISDVASGYADRVQSLRRARGGRKR